MTSPTMTIKHAKELAIIANSRLPRVGFEVRVMVDVVAIANQPHLREQWLQNVAGRFRVIEMVTAFPCFEQRM